MLIIPAIDIIDKKVVRLSKGDYNKSTVYSQSPVDQAKIYDDFGFDWLHIVDLMGSKEGKFNITDIISEIKKKTDLKVESGGGIRSLDDVDKLISVGVDKIVIGSISVNNRDEFEKIVSKFGSREIITAVDAKDEFIAVQGWTEKSRIHINDHIKYCIDLGLDTFLCTDISKDGMLKGPSFDLYKKLTSEFDNAKLIASGGISCMDDLLELENFKMYAVVVGKAIYENKINLKDLPALQN